MGRRIIRQRARGDCGLAALSTYLSRTHTYDEVAQAATLFAFAGGCCGVRLRELRAIAATLGVAFTVRRRFDLNRDEGVLRLYGSHTSRCGHWVAIAKGRILDPATGGRKPWPEYADRYQARFGTLLRAA